MGKRERERESYKDKGGRKRDRQCEPETGRDRESERDRGARRERGKFLLDHFVRSVYPRRAISVLTAPGASAT